MWSILISPVVGCLLLPALLLISSPVIADDNGQGKASRGDYLLGVGDKISISVYDEEELSVSVVIPGSGVISYPFLGEIKVGGITSRDLENTLDQGLRGKYLIDPKVTVSIIQYRPFFIHGEVKQSGGYPYQPGLSLRKAITLAGGFTERANKNRIRVIRERSQQQGAVPIGMDDPVYPGDTVIIEESLF